MTAANLPVIIKAKMDATIGLVGPGNLLPGLVWVQPFRRDKTLEIFSSDGMHYNPGARTTRGIRRSGFFGIEGTIPGEEDLFPEIRFIAEAHANGKQAIEEAAERCMQIFDQHVEFPASHAPMFFRIVGCTPPEDSEEFKGASEATLTLQVKSRWTTVSSY